MLRCEPFKRACRRRSPHRKPKNSFIAYRVSLAWATANRLHRHFLKEVFVNHLPIAQKQHWQILRAIRTGDTDEVESLVRRHNQSALRAYQEYLRRQKSGRGNGAAYGGFRVNS
jgi:DNA-binding GntR family transcriptional regulator